MIIETNSEKETWDLGFSLGEKACAGQVYTLVGDLGVGKTIFTKGLAKGLGIDEPVSSPTFTIVQVYDEGRLPFYHFDVYRIGDVEEGIMIETPAAAVISDLLAKEVDFFSIGTNDLTQYTLAIDRQNAKLDAFYNPHHEAVLRLIQMVVDNAHKEGIWAGICGELGADTTLTERFLEMGLDELSVSPGAILPIRKIVRESEIG